MIELKATVFPEVKVIVKKRFSDERGFFIETYRQPLYEEMGILDRFVQDNHSFSKRGTIRGMHFQSFPGQAKLLSVIAGVIYDVFVDVRPDSPTFGQWDSYLLDAKNGEQIYIPVGFAHGFAALSEEAHVLYKVSSVFDPKTEQTFRFDDPQVGIDWPVSHPILSPKDRTAPSFAEVCR